jgi:electron transfer flavoprotein alpha subunit
MTKTLIIAEVEKNVLKPAAKNLVTAARQISDDVHILLIGSDVSGPAATAAEIDGVKQVITITDPESAHVVLPEQVAPDLAQLIKTGAYTHVIMPASVFGKNMMPRIAALLDMQPISDVIRITSPDTFMRPIYAGNAIATVQSTDPIKIMTVRPTTFTGAGTSPAPAPITAQSLSGQDTNSVTFIRHDISVSARPELTAARVVISGGRGVGSSENFNLIEGLADTLSGAVGASRAAVDAGYVPNDYQVGQTGKIVAPDLYIAVGISGAIQHLAGMKDSKVIVAINKDPDAPIFGVADYGLVADLFTAVPELTSKLKK